MSAEIQFNNIVLSLTREQAKILTAAIHDALYETDMQPEYDILSSVKISLDNALEAIDEKRAE